MDAEYWFDGLACWDLVAVGLFQGGFTCFCVGLRLFIGGALWRFWAVGLRPVEPCMGFSIPCGPEAGYQHATGLLLLGLRPI